MTDHGSDAAEVHRVVGLVVIKRRLQNSRRECDVVLRRVIASVNGHRRIRPVTFIERRANLIETALQVVLVRALGITQGVAAHDLKFPVVPPLVGVANPIGDGG